MQNKNYNSSIILCIVFIDAYDKRIILYRDQEEAEMAVIVKSEGTKSESGHGTSISIHSEVAESLSYVKAIQNAVHNDIMQASSNTLSNS